MIGRVFLTAALFLALTTSAHAKLLFEDDAEDSPVKSGWKYAQHTTSKPGWEFSTTTEQAREGQSSYKAILEPVKSGKGRKYYNPAAGDMHAQLALLAKISQGPPHGRYFTFGKTYWLGYSMYVPEGMLLPNNMNLLDLHAVKDKCDKPKAAPIDIFGNGNSFKVRIKADDRKCSNTKTYTRQAKYFPKGVKSGWNDIVISFQLSYQSDGFFKMWVNRNPGDLPDVNDKGPNAYNDDRPPYLKFGPYGPVKRRVTLFYDAFRIGDEISSFAEVSPKGGNPSPESEPELEPEPKPKP